MKKARRKFCAFSFSIYFYTKDHVHFSTTYLALYMVNFQATPKFLRNVVLEKFHCQINIAINPRYHKLSDCYDILDKLDNLNSVFTSRWSELTHISLITIFFINAELILLSVYQKVFTFCRDVRRKWLLI